MESFRTIKDIRNIMVLSAAIGAATQGQAIQLNTPVKLLLTTTVCSTVFLGNLGCFASSKILAEDLTYLEPVENTLSNAQNNLLLAQNPQIQRTIIDVQYDDPDSVIYEMGVQYEWLRTWDISFSGQTWIEDNGRTLTYKGDENNGSFEVAAQFAPKEYLGVSLTQEPELMMQVHSAGSLSSRKNGYFDHSLRRIASDVLAKYYSIAPEGAYIVQYRDLNNTQRLDTFMPLYRSKTDKTIVGWYFDIGIPSGQTDVPDSFIRVAFYPQQDGNYARSIKIMTGWLPM